LILLAVFAHSLHPMLMFPIFIPIFSHLPTDFSPMLVHPEQVQAESTVQPLHHSPPLLSQANPNQQAVNRRRPRRRLAGRGGICVVSPGLLERNNTLWTLEPLFLWRSDPNTIVPERLEVSDDTGKIVWETSLTPTAQSALYAGEPLIPGQVYQWRLEWSRQGMNEAMDYSFEILNSARREQIYQGLQDLAQQTPSGISSEAVANAQATFLLDQPEELWSDAFQIMQALSNTSPEAQQTLSTWIDIACDSTLP
jgi:hypothetical protein